MLKIKLILLLCGCLVTNSYAAVWQIVYPRPIGEGDPRNEYPVALLALALEQTGVKYRLLPSENILQQGKATKLLQENREINLVWVMTDEQREANLLPIRIPIYKGLIGWRVFLINRKQIGEFAEVSDLKQLMNYKAIQGHDWTDTKILQSNGFSVATSREYSALFSMLTDQQGDFFPRSVSEVLGEVKGMATQDIVLESALGIRYPTAIYFFVNKGNKVLARLLQAGLEKAIDNGEFDALFNRVHRGILEQIDIKKRRFFELNNPVLPPNTPLNRKQLWYQGEGIRP